MKTALRQLLKGDPAIAALAPGGIDWLSRAQVGGPSFVLLQQISGAEGQTQGGPDGLESARVQIDSWAASAAEADALAVSIRRLLNGYRGGAFGGVFHVASRDGREDLENGGEAYRVSQDFMVHYRREHDA